jgi:hypothetical protein
MSTDYNLITEIFEKNLCYGDSSQLCIHQSEKELLFASSPDLQNNSLINLYSISKLFISLAILRLIQKKTLSFDTPLSSCWDGFRGKHKKSITLAHVLLHQSGLPHFDKKLKTEDLYDWNFILNLLEGQDCIFEPGTKTAYQARTYGFILGKIITSVTNKSLQNAINSLLDIEDLNIYFGVPKSELYRVAPLCLPSDLLLNLDEYTRNKELKVGGKYSDLVFKNPCNTILSPNSSDWIQSSLPSSGAFSNARYICNAISRILKLDSGAFRAFILNHVLKGDVQFDETLGFNILWHYGFQGNSGEFCSVKKNRFGIRAIGGSICFIDLIEDLIFCYTTRIMIPQVGLYPAHDMRIKPIIDII